MQSKKYKGRSFLGTLFFIGIGFVIGFYNAEILSAVKQAVQSFRSQ